MACCDLLRQGAQATYAVVSHEPRSGDVVVGVPTTSMLVFDASNATVRETEPMTEIEV